MHVKIRKRIGNPTLYNAKINYSHYLYLIQNDMKNYKSKKDSKEEGKSADCGAIYNWKRCIGLCKVPIS